MSASNRLFVLVGGPLLIILVCLGLSVLYGCKYLNLSDLDQFSAKSRNDLKLCHLSSLYYQKPSNSEDVDFPKIRRMFRKDICRYRSLQPVPVLLHDNPISQKIEILGGLWSIDITKQTQMSNSQILSPSQPSVCIPRTFANITWQEVKNVFEEVLGPGCVERVDMVRKTGRSDERFQRVFIHFRQWPSSTRAQQVRRKLLDGNEIKIVYDEPWFWKCSASRVPKPEGNRGRSPSAHRPHHARGSPARARRDNNRRSGRGTDSHAAGSPNRGPNSRLEEGEMSQGE